MASATYRPEHEPFEPDPTGWVDTGPAATGPAATGPVDTGPAATGPASAGSAAAGPEQHEFAAPGDAPAPDLAPVPDVTPVPGYELVDFSRIEGTPCPCGLARRAFTQTEDFPATIHVTEISADARLHYHRRLTETYFFLECGPDARMQLNDEILPVQPGMCLLIRPGTRHRAIGRMKVLIVVFPKFDPHDEWLDSTNGWTNRYELHHPPTSRDE